jgi:hypothetical protein
MKKAHGVVRNYAMRFLIAEEKKLSEPESRLAILSAPIALLCVAAAAL